MNEKIYDSLFVPQFKIDICNYITELILKNKIEDRISKNPTGAMKGLPRCAFWRKENINQHPQFKQLAADYVVELSYVKKLMMSFGAKTIVKYVREKNVITFAYQNLSQRKTTLYNLWQLHVQDRQELNKKKKIEVSDSQKTRNKTMKSKMTGLL